MYKVLDPLKRTFKKKIPKIVKCALKYILIKKFFKLKFWFLDN